MWSLFGKERMLTSAQDSQLHLICRIKCGIKHQQLCSDVDVVFLRTVSQGFQVAYVMP